MRRRGSEAIRRLVRQALKLPIGAAESADAIADGLV